MSFRFVVEEGKVAEFAKAVRDDNPAHRDRAAAEEQGLTGIPAPLTFVAASAHWRSGPNPLAEQNLDLTRTLHGESEWERVLWRPNPFPDNYVPETFLSSLSRNGEYLWDRITPNFLTNSSSQQTFDLIPTGISSQPLQL